MNILLISECTGRAINETRRILDQFAERRGERTWQTPITMEGLNTLRRLLRKTARKNTAVACHWIRGRDHAELMWVVGNARLFNPQGAVPTNTTARDVLRSADENDWHTGEDISLLAQMAALLHDLGKASVAFQKRLQSPLTEKSLYRHEWVSLRLFLAFVGGDDDATWLQRLANPAPEDDAAWLAEDRYWRDGLDAGAPKAFAHLPPLAAAIAWLVVTHHRLLTLPVEGADGEGKESLWFGKRSASFNPGQLAALWESVDAAWNDWNDERHRATPAQVQPYWAMASELPVVLPAWRKRAAKLAQRLLVMQAKAGKGDWLGNPYVMHIARMGLMLADHHYSSLEPDAAERVRGDGQCGLYANTDKRGYLKQHLDEHLLGVARDAAMLCRNLPGFARHLPALQHRTLRKRSKHPDFRWQDKAFDAAEGMREKAEQHGAFIVNMASTGRGKTFANARIMYALSNPQWGMRCSFAVGLRTLTLQMGRAYRDMLDVGEDALAIRVGGSANRQLFEYHEARAEASGSASTQQLIEEDNAVFFDGNEQNHPLLRMTRNDARIAGLLSAPLLVCTIDHLTPATEAQRAGRQIAPMLRLMSSDLVLDEPDDFGIEDLPALARLVHWAGLLGSRVLLSSATLPPDLVQGLFEAYRQGRIHYQRNRGSGGGQVMPEPPVACLWVDEFKSSASDCVTPAAFAQAHKEFIQSRIKSLADLPPKQMGKLLPLPITERDTSRIRAAFADHVREAVMEAHAAHAEVDAVSGKRVSFGLVRMANIEPLYDVAMELFRLGAPPGARLHLCVYHSQFPLIMRSAIENALDTALGARAKGTLYSLPDVRNALDSGDEHDHLFVVLASPVAEVGRDHDYDWAVVEPSSMRSLIQLAGRVRRHREPGNGQPNVLVFDTNLKHFEQPGKPAFVRPGFEELQKPRDRPRPLQLKHHALQQLLDADQYAAIDARPRIQRAELSSLMPYSRLVDLEHVRMHLQMGDANGEELNASNLWATPLAHLTWALPQQQPFRDDRGRKEQLLAFLPDEDETRLLMHRVDEDRLRKRGGQREGAYTTAEGSCVPVDVAAHMGPRIGAWFNFDMLTLLKELSEAQDIDLDAAAERFSVVSVPLPGSSGIPRWYWHPVLGMKLAK